MTTLCVVPLQQELDSLCHGWVMLGYTTSMLSVGCLDAHHIPQLDLFVAPGGHGKTQYLLDRLPHIDTVICLGAAGALATDLAVGDVVIASETVEHDYTQRFRPHPLPRFPADPVLLADFQQLPLQGLTFRVHVGIMASGDEDVIELERATALRHATAACAVAWEGAGGARAARFNERPFLEVRGITDTADHRAAADFAVNLPLTMTHVARLITLWRTTEPLLPDACLTLRLAAVAR